MIPSLDEEEQGPILPSLEKEKVKSEPLQDEGPVISSLESKNQKEGSIARAWRAANTPIVDVSPQTRQMMEEYKKAHPIVGTIGNFGVDAMLSASSPLGLGLEAT